MWYRGTLRQARHVSRLGASGCVYGVIAAALCSLLAFPRRHRHTWVWYAFGFLPQLWDLALEFEAVWAGSGLAAYVHSLQHGDRINHAAHAGGALFGVAFMAVQAMMGI